MQTNNNFQITGFVAVDAQIHQFSNTSVARFPLSIRRNGKKAADQKKVSALMNMECWRKNTNTNDFELLAKGNRVTIEGYFKPETWTDKNNKQHDRIIFRVVKIVAYEEEKPAASEKKPKKAKKNMKKAA